MPRAGGDSPYSFPRELRLRKRKEFESVFRRGRRVDLGFVVFYVLPNGFGHPRFGVVVPKRVARKATERNRIKRLFREFFRLNKPRFNSMDVVAVVREKVLSYRELESRLSGLDVG